jgi:hypothetical protein
MSLEFTTQPCCDSLRVSKLAFPQCNDLEAHSAQCIHRPSVARAVRFELGFPKRAVALRYRSPHASAMGVPVTAVNKERPTATSIGEIRRSR